MAPMLHIFMYHGIFGCAANAFSEGQSLQYKYDKTNGHRNIEVRSRDNCIELCCWRFSCEQ